MVFVNGIAVATHEGGEVFDKDPEDVGLFFFLGECREEGDEEGKEEEEFHLSTGFHHGSQQKAIAGKRFVSFDGVVVVFD